MKASLISAAALCMVSGMAIAQDADCCESKAGECEVVVECVGGEPAGGNYEVKLMVDEDGNLSTQLQRVAEAAAAGAIGAGQPEVETHMTIIQKNDDHEYKVEIKGDDVKAWADGERVPGKRLKVTDKVIKILSADGDTVAEFQRMAGNTFKFGGDDDQRIMLRGLHEGNDDPIIWEGEDGQRLEMLKDLNIQLGDEGGNMIFMQPEMDHPPVMIGINMGSLDEVDVSDRTREVLDDRGFDSDEVFVVLGVIDGTPADEAGLREGDVVFRVDGHNGVNAEDLRDVLSGKEPGDVIEFALVRNGRVREVELELAKWNAEKLGILRYDMNFGGGDNPMTFQWQSDDEDVRKQLHEHLQELGKGNKDLAIELEALVERLHGDGEQGFSFDLAPRVRVLPEGEGDQRFMVRPAPRAEAFGGYEARLDRIEARLERLEARIDRIINALEDR